MEQAAGKRGSRAAVSACHDTGLARARRREKSSGKESGLRTKEGKLGMPAKATPWGARVEVEEENRRRMGELTLLRKRKGNNRPKYRR